MNKHANASAVRCETRSEVRVCREDGKPPHDELTLAMRRFIDVVSRRMLEGNPLVRRHAETPDVAQDASLKLFLALQTLTPDDRRHLENLAALQVRRTIIDLARQHAKAQRAGLRKWTPNSRQGDCRDLLQLQSDRSAGPDDLLHWAELHELVEILADDEREVFQLIWYRGMSTAEVADLLNTNQRTVQRRWREARMQLAESLDSSMAESV